MRLLDIRWIAVWAIILEHLYTWRRNYNRIIDSFWWPFLDLITWGLTSTYLSQSYDLTENIVAILLGGIILWYFVQQAQRDVSVTLLDEAWNRNFVNIFTTPLRLREFLLAALILGGIKLIATMLVLTSISYFFYRFNIFSLGIFLVPAILNLIIVGWWIGFIVDGLILKYGYRVESLAWSFVFIIYPFSAVMYPVSSLPDWAQAVASVLPTSYIFENMRLILFSGTFSLPYILVGTAWNIVYLTGSLLFVKFMFTQALRSGRLVKLN